ncbi:MAG: hypothetical protein MUF71_12305 [Candidatus Kapabacteria bacterium]|jgi:hypothetical protein|nr:hypothetical protein [Candidatus Kapabacteria bacterium]
MEYSVKSYSTPPAPAEKHSPMPPQTPHGYYVLRGCGCSRHAPTRKPFPVSRSGQVVQSCCVLIRRYLVIHVASAQKSLRVDLVRFALHFFNLIFLKM